jgi:hypothetical protein
MVQAPSLILYEIASDLVDLRNQRVGSGGILLSINYLVLNETKWYE